MSPSSYLSHAQQCCDLLRGQVGRLRCREFDREGHSVQAVTDDHDNNARRRHTCRAALRAVVTLPRTASVSAIPVSDMAEPRWSGMAALRSADS